MGKQSFKFVLFETSTVKIKKKLFTYMTGFVFSICCHKTILIILIKSEKLLTINLNNRS